MSDREGQRPDERLEQTIEPVRRTETRARDEDGSSSRRWQAPLFALALALAVAGVVAVFVYLPREVAPPPAPPPEPEPAAAAAPAVPALSPEEKATLKADAEKLLAQLLEQQQALNARSVSSWGDTTWSAYQTAARDGDDAYLAEDFQASVDDYRQALDIGEQLFARSNSLVEQALQAGDEAIAAGNAELAASQFDLVLSIDPENARAKAGRARAEALPDVLEAMRRGDTLAEDGELEQAAGAYREALGLDPKWQAAQTALDSVTARIAEARFDKLITDGYAAIEAGRNDHAAELFEQALGLRPDSSAASDGLAEARQGQQNDAIELAKIRASAFERRELWDDAIARYKEALATDPTLNFAIEGLERAQRRADLDAKLKALIEKPDLLLTDAVLADARRVLGQARAIDPAGPRLTEQKARLSRLIDLASTPIKVTLVSDNATEVTVYRVGELGSFDSKEVALKPGQYTAVGQRRGYRDVRTSFTVLPGRDNGPVKVVCEEPI